MKLVTFARMVAFSLLALPLHAAVDTVLVNWNHTWSFMHPMGTLPDRPAGGADPDFNTTWFLAQPDFTTQYDGPTFGAAPRQNGVPATLSSYDSGSGPGPFAYDTVTYYTTAGAEFTATGTALTQPSTGNRRTAYFRTTFNVAADARLPVLRYLLDDGGYVYLDGVLVARINCPATNDTYTVLASNTTNTEDTLRTINLATVGAQANGTVLVAVPQLAAGTHTLAVSLHNQAVGSSDLAMAVQLRGSVGALLNTPAVSNVVRNDNGSPTTPGDDTFTFDVTVTGTGLGPNWTTADGTPSSGAYGVPVTMGPFFTAFSPVTINFADATDPTGTNRVVVAAPGCSMSATTGAYVYNDFGTPELTDDQFEVDVIVSQRFGSDTWLSGANPSSGAYGTPVRMGPFPVTVPTVITFQDNQVNGCTTSLNILPPARIGVASIPGAASTNLIAQGVVGTVAPWVANSTLLALTQSNGGGTNPHVRATIPFPLTGVTGPKRLRFDLNIVDTSTGSNFETEDQLRLEIVTVSGGVTNVIEATDALDTNNNGYVNGHSTTAALPYDTNRQLDEFNLPLVALAGTINYTLRFQSVFTNTLDSIQLVARGVNNATSEQFNLRNIRLDIATCEITATAGTVTFDNGGDNDAANDTYSFPVTVGTVFVGESTGWTSDANPASGLYADAQPVTFGPFSVNAGPRVVTISDAAGGSGCIAVVSNAPPASAVAVAVSNIIRLDNGPGTDDDTWQFTATVTGTAVGLNHTNNLTSALGTYGTPLVVGPLAFTGNVSASFGDVARPSAFRTVNVTPPAARHVMGVASLGTTYNFGAALGEAQSATWVNNAALRTLTLANGGGADQAVRSEWLDLNGLQGPVQFSAEVLARETSAGSGFEANDTLLARLLYVDGGITNTVNLISNYDRNGSGRVNGYTGVTNANAATVAIDYSNNAARDEFNFGAVPAAGVFTNNVALSWLIPDSATAARFEILGANNSTSEAFILQNAAFTFLADSEPDGLPDEWETTYFPSTVFGAADDSDGDGATNLQEFLAGTHPAQTFSVLRVANPEVNGTAYSVTWDTVAGKFYQLQFTPDALPSTTWVNLGSVQRATGDTLTLSGTLPAPGRGYLRVMLVP